MSREPSETETDPALVAHRDRLLETLRGYGRVAVAFSGGVDSTVVAQAARVALGDAAVAVTAVSDSLAAGELEEAEALARRIGIAHRVIRTEEFADPNYLRNNTDRCYFCKSELYGRLSGAARHAGRRRDRLGRQHRRLGRPPPRHARRGRERRPAPAPGVRPGQGRGPRPGQGLGPARPGTSRRPPASPAGSPTASPSPPSGSG